MICTLLDNKILDHTDVVIRALPVSTAPLEVWRYNGNLKFGIQLVNIHRICVKSTDT